MDRYIVVSADTHAGLPTQQYREYLEKKYHQAFDQFLAEREAQIAELTRLGVRNEKFAKSWYEEHEDSLNAGWDATKRDQELDADGVSGEVIFPDADAVESRTCVPFGAGLGLSGDIDPELGLAGSKAHNRWLAEMCSHSPERRRGVALIPVTADLDEVIGEIEQARKSGLGAVMIPAMWVDQAPYNDPRYDRVWATCEDLELPVVTHSGAAPRDEYENHLGIYLSEVSWWPARPLWFMLWSGVFERFPSLKFGITEAGCWWLPGMLWYWDRLYTGQKGAEKLGAKPFGEVSMLPSEYFDRNCFVGASNTKRREIALRYEIGIDNLLWGNDFPHPEGTWPHTRQWLANAFHDIPIAETRRMIGVATSQVYGFDMDALKPIADRIGPTPEDLGQTANDPTGVDLHEKWKVTREVGRHWLTDHDFPLIG